MLDKSDLSKIRQILREEIENEVQSAKGELNSQMIMSRMRIQDDIENVKDRVKNLEIKIRRGDNKEEEALYVDEE